MKIECLVTLDELNKITKMAGNVVRRLKAPKHVSRNTKY